MVFPIDGDVLVLMQVRQVHYIQHPRPYSVLGDAVNLAARLESACKTYDTDLIISEYSLVEGYNYDFLDEVTVKGKSEPVKIYTIQK